jgi:hypothetical protein
VLLLLHLKIVKDMDNKGLTKKVSVNK